MDDIPLFNISVSSRSNPTLWILFPLFNIWVSSSSNPTLWMISSYSIYEFPLSTILLYGWYPSIQYLVMSGMTNQDAKSEDAYDYGCTLSIVHEECIKINNITIKKRNLCNLNKYLTSKKVGCNIISSKTWNS